MKASDLLVRLRAYLAEHEDCEVKLYSEQSAFEDAFDFKYSEVVTDVRVVNDWPLPGESLIVGDTENPGKYLVLFYNSENVGS